MSRPAVSVVMPFAGSAAQARAALTTLRTLETHAGDELILVDNCGTVAPAEEVQVVRAAAERSPAHARNVGADRARGEWILFLDSDTEVPHDLLDRYFVAAISDLVGALAGGVTAAPGATSLAARYGAAKGFLSQDAHLAHPFMPRAVAANLLVRRAAFEQVGGFFEGVRAAEDTDFSWRLQRAGWKLEGRSEAVVEHRYRTTVRALRRQWRGYAAGRAWLGRRYDGFAPEPALRRAAGRALHRGSTRAVAPPAPTTPSPSGPAVAHRLAGRDRVGHLALDALMGLEELAGLALSNRPHRPPARAIQVVLVAERFPVRGDSLAEFALTLAGARVEAVGRPDAPAQLAARELRIDYREDDGRLARALATIRLIVRHPVRCGRDLMRRRSGEPRLSAIAPAVTRLQRDSVARVHPLGGEEARALAARLGTLAGRRPAS